MKTLFSSPIGILVHSPNKLTLYVCIKQFDCAKWQLLFSFAYPENRDELSQIAYEKYGTCSESVHLCKGPVKRADLIHVYPEFFSKFTLRAYQLWLPKGQTCEQAILGAKFALFHIFQNSDNNYIGLNNHMA